MADRQDNFSRSEPHLGAQSEATGVGATLVASSEGDAQLGRRDSPSKLGPGASPLPRSAATTGTRWEALFGKRHAARRSAGPKPGGPRGLLDQAAEAGRDAATQIADEFRGAAESFLNERKTRAADTVRGLADALNHAAGDLARESPPIADYAGRAAGRIEEFADQLHERSWVSILAEAEAIARRQPALFLLGAAGLGFAMGRLMLASPRNRADPAGEAMLDPNSPGASVGAASATTATGASMTRLEIF
jgi:hypothetical protein